jgi:hypothetical protein
MGLPKIGLPPVARVAASQSALVDATRLTERKEDVMMPDRSFTLPSFTA